MRLLLLAVAALAMAGCVSPSAPTPDPSAPGKGPAWSFTAIDGQTYSRDQPAGNATVLFFMATWCASCRTKAPVIAEVVADPAYEGVRVYSLDFDPSEKPEDLRAWQEKYAQPWPHGIDPQLSIQRTFGVRTQSSVVVLDGDGKVVEHFGYGMVTDAGLRDALARALSPDAA